MKIVTSAIAAVAVTASVASADFFYAELEGFAQIVDQNGTVFETYNEETVTSLFGPYDFVGYEGTAYVDVVTDPYVLTGSLTWTDSSGDMLVMDVEGVGFGFPEDYQNASGTWTMTSGTGIYENLTGYGNWSRTLIFVDQGYALSTSDFGGWLVPAPGSLALLGLGALATRRRR